MAWIAIGVLGKARMVPTNRAKVGFLSSLGAGGMGEVFRPYEMVSLVGSDVLKQPAPRRQVDIP